MPMTRPLVFCAQTETPEIKTARDRTIAARRVQGEQERRLQLRSAIQCPPAEIDFVYQYGSQRQKSGSLKRNTVATREGLIEGVDNTVTKDCARHIGQPRLTRFLVRIILCRFRPNLTRIVEG